MTNSHTFQGILRTVVKYKVVTPMPRTDILNEKTRL